MNYINVHSKKVICELLANYSGIKCNYIFVEQ